MSPNIANDLLTSPLATSSGMCTRKISKSNLHTAMKFTEHTVFTYFYCSFSSIPAWLIPPVASLVINTSFFLSGYANDYNTIAPQC